MQHPGGQAVLGMTRMGEGQGRGEQQGGGGEDLGVFHGGSLGINSWTQNLFTTCCASAKRR